METAKSNHPTTLKNFLLLTVFWVFLFGCAKGSKNSVDAVVIPELDFSCSQIQASGCGSTPSEGVTVYAGLLADHSVDCESYIQTLPLGEFRPHFEAFGQTTAHFSNGFIADSIHNWVGPLSDAEPLLEKADYLACVFVDTNANGQLDSGEPLGEGQLSITTSSDPVEDWFVFP